MGAGAAGLVVDSKQTSYRDIFKVLQRLLRNPDSTEFVYAAADPRRRTRCGPKPKPL
jgi:hypothetical protein